MAIMSSSVTLANYGLRQVGPLALLEACLPVVELPPNVAGLQAGRLPFEPAAAHHRNEILKGISGGSLKLR